LSDNSEFLCEQKDLEKKAYVLSRPGVNAQGGVFHVCAKKPSQPALDVDVIAGSDPSR
jgi:hypothetical protein